MRVYNNYNYLIHRWCQQKNGISVSEKTGILKFSVFISFNKFTSFQDVRIIRVFNFIEKITGKKPNFYKFSSGYVGNSRQYSVTVKTDLNRKNLGNFLYYLRFCVLPLERRRFGFSVDEAILDEKSFTFKNWDVFSGLNTPTAVGSLRVFIKGSPFILKDWLSLHGLCYRE